MKSLKGILTASNKKLRLETLEKCEGVLHKLYEQVEGPVDTKSSSKNQQNVSQKVQQRPRSPPKEERSSLSSYLQQLHDSQHEQSQQSRFSQGQGPSPRGPPGNRPSPWMYNQMPRDQRDQNDQRPQNQTSPWA